MKNSVLRNPKTVLMETFENVTLSKDYRLRLQIIACSVRLKREVSLDDMKWATKLVEHNNHARGIWERTTGQ